MPGLLFYQHMHMIRHDAPGDETIAFAVEVFQGLHDDGGHPFVAQITGAFSTVCVFFDLLSQSLGSLKSRQVWQNEVSYRA